jgi:sphingomyelin phosphodiesterase acid-like 3
MSAKLRHLFVLMLVGGVAMPGWQPVNASAPHRDARFYRVVTLADLHFNPLYDPTLYSALMAAEPSQWATIYQGSKIKNPAAAGTDTNYPLLVLTLKSLKQKTVASPVVLFTGDMLGHNIPPMFYTLYYKTAQYPTPSSAAVAAMQQFIDKTVAFVAAQVRASAGDAPVIFAVGNIDTYGVGLGPDSTFLTNNAQTFYTQFLGNSVDQEAFIGTFTTDGYYSAQPLGSTLRVLGLNTNSFVAGVPSNSEADPELEWLNAQLEAAQAAGQKVWILMHVPPGANSQSTAQNAAKAGTPDQVNESTTAMMWDSHYEAIFMQTLANYPGVVTLMLAGHTHMDEYRILPTGHILEQLPGISPCFGNNPAFKVLTVKKDTLTATDYDSFYYDLSRRPDQFERLYQLSATYGWQVSLDSSLRWLYPQLVGNKVVRGEYVYYYASGSIALIPATKTPWNPINSPDWPIFACTISTLDEPDYIDCVNTY